MGTFLWESLHRTILTKEKDSVFESNRILRIVSYSFSEVGNRFAIYINLQAE